MDIGGSKIEAAALGPGGRVAARRRAPVPRDLGGTLRLTRELVAAVEAEAGGAAARRIGVGTPGAISPRDGLLRGSNAAWLNGVALQRELAAALGRPVRCANDADCFALSEARDGAGAGARIVFGVIMGTGLGGGIVVDGRLSPGAAGTSGEWGHAPLAAASVAELHGPECWCGRRGCLESWLSGPGLAADHARALGLAPGEGPGAAEIAAMAEAGDAAAAASLARHAERFGRALAPVADLLSPGAVVLGGGLSNLPGIAERIAKAMARHVFLDRPGPPVRRHLHGDSSGVRGAARLWDDAFEEEPA